MKNFATTEAAFNDTRDLLMQELHNDLLKPDRTCQESRLCILQRVKWSIRDKIEALERLTVEDVTHFLPEFQNTVHVQAYMHVCVYVCVVYTCLYVGVDIIVPSELV
ncbi:hypothetical protein SARC_16412 [Sphaeroforma arctica JP610]|uniref:Uncharacterized protein n=1 Tax=Sphaeroforma arctica JP610 TaxID=667725 RepID=A0A0L0F4E7_9EUKA|nr:hypothetical protein SARC_16412 [Sphaeroforma arctica JP610]KNC71053.1 hypothetical protein SARC_16412 [Sphaeroforma arctica JP610]|eukprot:XP_014144955.1 hypothetical protein SARC_16412 [Sphaeroforma arctica JP610]